MGLPQAYDSRVHVKAAVGRGHGGISGLGFVDRLQWTMRSTCKTSLAEHGVICYDSVSAVVMKGADMTAMKMHRIEKRRGVI